MWKKARIKRNSLPGVFAWEDEFRGSRWPKTCAYLMEVGIDPTLISEEMTLAGYWEFLLDESGRKFTWGTSDEMATIFRQWPSIDIALDVAFGIAAEDLERWEP